MSAPAYGSVRDRTPQCIKRLTHNCKGPRAKRQVLHTLPWGERIPTIVLSNQALWGVRRTGMHPSCTNVKAASRTA